MQIRPATCQDIDTITSILLEGKQAIAELGIAQWQRPDYPSRAVAEADIAAGVSLVAVEDGEILGTLALILAGDESYENIDGSWLHVEANNTPHAAAIHRTAVARRAARRGVMGALFSHAAQVARHAGCDSLRIDTHPGNVRMRSFLEKQGFVLCGTLELTTGEPEPLRLAYELLL